MAIEYDQFIDQGTTFIANVTVDSVDLTEATILAEIKREYTSTDIAATFEIVPVSLINGQFQLMLTAAQTAALWPGRYVYDAKYTIGTLVVRIIQGIVTVDPCVSI